MITNYKKLITLTILHNYYVSGICKDFSIIPTEETISLLNGYRLKLKATPTGFFILYQSRDGSPVVPVDTDIKLTFMLVSNNTALFNFTELPLLSNSNSIYLLENNSMSEPLVLSNNQVELFGSTINYAFALGQNTSRIKLINFNNETIIDQLISPISEDPTGTFNFNYQFMLNGFANGKYTIEHYAGIDNNTLQQQSVVYVSPSVVKQKPFAVIELLQSQASIDSAYSTAIDYTIEYDRKLIELSYDLKIEEDYSGKIFFIEDAAVSQPDTPYSTINRLKGDVDLANSKIIHFNVDVDDNPVDFPLFEKPRLGLELVRYNEDETGREVVLQNLPNPSAKSPNPKVFISK